MSGGKIFSFEADAITSNGNSCTVIKKGAEIQELIFDIDGEQISVIDGYADEEKLEKHKGSKSAWLLPFPNRLVEGKYLFDNQAFQFPIDEPTRNNRLHGFHKALAFEKKSFGEYFYYYHAEENYYPFEFQSVVKYFFKDAVFHFNFTIDALSKMPIAAGWHPYFKLPSDLETWKITIPTAKKIEVNENLIPTGKKSEISNQFDLKNASLDTCFLLQPNDHHKVILEDDYYILEICWKQHVYLQLYIPPDRKSIAIEPMTGNINCFQNLQGLSILQPQESISICGTITCTRKK